MGTIDLQHRRGARCGPPVLPDRRGHGGPCSVRRGRGSLLTGEEVGGEPPPAPAVPPISGRRAWPAWPPSGAPPSPPFHLRPAWPAVPRRRPVGIGGSVGRLLGCCPGGGVPLRRPRCCPSEKEGGLGRFDALLGTFPAREKYPGVWGRSPYREVPRGLGAEPLPGSTPGCGGGAPTGEHPECGAGQAPAHPRPAAGESALHRPGAPAQSVQNRQPKIWGGKGKTALQMSRPGV